MTAIRASRKMNVVSDSSASVLRRLQRAWPKVFFLIPLFPVGRWQMSNDDKRASMINDQPWSFTHFLSLVVSLFSSNINHPIPWFKWETAGIPEPDRDSDLNSDWDKTKILTQTQTRTQDPNPGRTWTLSATIELETFPKFSTVFTTAWTNLHVDVGLSNEADTKGTVQRLTRELSLKNKYTRSYRNWRESGEKAYHQKFQT